MRRLAVLAGIVAFALGVGTLLAPDILTVDGVFLPVVAILALALAARAAQIRRGGDRTRAETPDPEVAEPVPAPGDDLREALAAFTNVRRRGGTRSLRAGLRAAAVRVLTRVGIEEREAKARVDAGTWTDDPVAAAFLAGVGGTQSLRGRLRAAAGGESEFRRGVRRTVDAIVDASQLPYEGGQSAGRGDTDQTAADGAGPAPGGGEPDGAGGPTLDPSQVVATVTAEAPSTAETGHWRGISALALIAVGVGVLARQPAVVLAAVVGLGYTAYARSGTPPEPSLAVDREITEPEPAPGDQVSIAVTVTNEGDGVLPDLRLVDGVPRALAVTQGAARRGTALRPGESTTLQYSVEARRGVHQFGPALVIARDHPGTYEHVGRIEAPGAVTCIPALRPVDRMPLHPAATQAAGRVATTTGGEGIEFFGVREYRPGDPPARVDWNRRARTGELATVDLREERAATVVLVIDARPVAHVAPTPTAPSAADRCVDAAGRVAATLLDTGNRVGLDAFGSDDCWLAPALGRDQRARIRERLATHPALAPTPGREPDTVGWQQRFRRRVPDGAELVVCSPLPDGSAALFANQLAASGYPVTVISPDATVTRTPDQRLARLDRQFRVADLRRARVRVVDWPWSESLDAALDRARDRWSR